MKKYLAILLGIIMMTALIACTNTDPTDPTVDPTVDPTIPTVPNGLLPLVATPDCAVPTLEGGWTCIWADEFDGDSLDETKWNYEIDGQGGGNQELQYYRRENVSVVDGKLIITARQESFMNRSYTSGRITTKYKGTFQYVRIVARAKMPTGRGTWPAIWMMPLFNRYGGWPNSGEIDIMEYVGYQPNVIHTTIHTRKFNHNIGTQIGYTKNITNAETEFNDYEMIWSPGRILTYVNGEQIGFGFTYSAAFNQDVPYHYAFPFDQEFYLILNLAVGGTWGGAMGIDPDVWPATMEVDYVRVYKQDYAVTDQTPPTAPTNIQIAMLKNTIFWNPSTDDRGVENYEIYLDGTFHRLANLNQHTFTGLVSGQTYAVQIRAIDFVGRGSEFSDTLLFTYLA